MDVDSLQLQPLHRHRYALINPLQVDEEMLDDLPLMPLVHERLLGSIDQMPRLLDLELLSFHERGLLLERSLLWVEQRRIPFFSSLIETQSSLEKIQSHLTFRLMLRNRSGKEFLFRYFDPQVFKHLLWINTDIQQAALLGPIKRWSWWDRNGLWHSYSPQSVWVGESISYLSNQLELLNRIGLFNLCIDDYESERHLHNLKSVPVDLIVRLVDKAITDHRLGDEDDIRLFVKQTWLHRNVHDHPFVQERLRRTQSGSMSYVRACADLTPTRLTQVVTELDQTDLGTRSLIAQKG